MFRHLPICLMFASAGLLHSDEGWKTKRVADWTDAETKQVLTDSAWGAMVTPAVKKESRPSVNRSGGLGVGPVGVGGVGRRRNTPPPQNPSESAAVEEKPFNVRWESGLPIREAELKARETNAPVVDEKYYGIAVYGIPNKLAKDLKTQGTIKIEGQKEIKTSSVDVIPRDDGTVVVFLFSRTREITAKDSRAEFSAQIGPYQFTYSFHVDEMVYQGKMEL